MATSRAPFPWFGGKQAMAPMLVDLLPAHTVYVEVFGGAASLLFSKPPAAIEVYNDIDSGLVNFFRVLRDPKRARELRRLLDLTPYSREEWRECRATWTDAPTDVEMARRWFVVVWQAFQGRIGNGGPRREGPGWRYAKSPSNNPASAYRAGIEALPQFCRRIAEVQIEHNDFEKVMAAYDTPATLFYLDPPYIRGARRGGGYNHELTDGDHERMIAAARRTVGMVIISGYHAPVYDDLLGDWRLIERAALTMSARTKRDERTECIWLSPSIAAHQPQLWSA